MVKFVITTITLLLNDHHFRLFYPMRRVTIAVKTIGTDVYLLFWSWYSLTVSFHVFILIVSRSLLIIWTQLWIFNDRAQWLEIEKALVGTSLQTVEQGWELGRDDRLSQLWFLKHLHGAENFDDLFDPGDHLGLITSISYMKREQTTFKCESSLEYIRLRWLMRRSSRTAGMDNILSQRSCISLQVNRS